MTGSKKFAFAAAALAFNVAFVSGAGAQTNSSETYRQLNLFGDVFEQVRAHNAAQYSGSTSANEPDSESACHASTRSSLGANGLQIRAQPTKRSAASRASAVTSRPRASRGRPT